jgi:flagellar motor switch protein FliM
MTTSAKAARRHRVREVDFRRPSKFTRDQVRRIETAHDAFCQAATSRLSAELRTELGLTVLGTDQLPYGVVMGEEIPRHAFVSILRIDELGTELALVIDMPLAQCLVHRLLGGSGTAFGAPPSSPITGVVVAVARRAVSSLVEALSSTWMDLADVTLSMAGTSTNPTAVQLVPASEPTLLLSVSAAIDGIASVITLMMPHRSVEPLVHHFELGAHVGGEVDTRAQAMMRDAVGGVDIEVRVGAGSTRMELRDVLALGPGDTVRLKKPVSAGVTLCVGDVATYQAHPGRNGNVRAVQVGPRVGGRK